MNRTANAGYSGTPLPKKLGFKSGQRVYVDGIPENYFDLLEPLPEGVTFGRQLVENVDVIHLFTRSRAELERKVPEYMGKLNAGGAIWVSWPKRTSKVPTDITEDLIRRIILPLGLVDVKVCAIDETWSGLRLVRRRSPLPEQ